MNECFGQLNTCLLVDICSLFSWVIWWVEWQSPQKIYPQPPDPVSVTLFEERVFADIIKDLEMRLSWIICAC